MPINPNIALSFQQPQPVNMLGMAGQAMALKAAADEMQGTQAIRNFYAQGGDLSTPEGQRQLMVAAPRAGGKLIKEQMDIQKAKMDVRKTEQEVIGSAIKTSRDMLTNISTPEEYIAWHEANHRDPVLGSYLAARGVTADQSRAKIMQELSKPGGLDKLKRESALGATKLQEELMQTERSTKVANIGAGPGYARVALEREKYAQQLATGGDLVNIEIRDENTGQMVPAIGRRDLRTGEIVPVEVRAAPMSMTIGPNTAVNNLAPAVAQAPGGAPVNTLVAPAAAAAPTPAQAPAVAAAQGPVLARPAPSAGELGRRAKEESSEKGKTTVNTLLGTLGKQYSDLLSKGAITDVNAPTMQNIQARTGASMLGQVAGQYTGSAAQSARDSIAQTRPLLLQAIKEATGMSAQQMNSNVELQTFLRAATDPTLSIQANIEAINNLSKLYGLGKEFQIEKGEVKPVAAGKTGGNLEDPLNIRK